MSFRVTASFLGTLLAGVIAVNTAAIAQSSSAPPSAKFDGKWSVKLVCDDVQDKGTVVKGYTFLFDVEVKNGRLEGKYGQPGSPASLEYVGVIQPDGSVEITASGRTGKPEHAVGGVDRGTPYSYLMSGKFDQSFGRATRTTLRPCEATFSKG